MREPLSCFLDIQKGEDAMYKDQPLVTSDARVHLEFVQCAQNLMLDLEMHSGGQTGWSIHIAVAQDGYHVSLLAPDGHRAAAPVDLHQFQEGVRRLLLGELNRWLETYSAALLS
jgi:hypothetical protein